MYVNDFNNFTLSKTKQERYRTYKQGTGGISIQL